MYKYIGYRHIQPYVYQFKTHAKQRWFGKTLMEIFTKEFGAFSTEYYVRQSYALIYYLYLIHILI